MLGAFHSNAANGHARWQVAKAWALEATAGYEVHKNVEALFASSNPGGHTVTGAISVQRAFGEHIVAEAGYQRQHQSYGTIAVISALPDSDREYVSVSYQFQRPLGR